LFILFILACGTTHLIDGLIFWTPVYRLSALVLAATSIISWAALFALYKVFPQAIQLKSPKQLKEIIAIRTSELERTNATLIKINQDLDTYLYAASHDLKSPINNMEGLLEILHEDVTNRQLPNTVIVEKLQESVNRVQQTIARLTDVVRLEKNPYDDIELLDINELLQEIVIENEELIRRSKAQFHLNFAQDKFEYSRSGMKSIIYNLVINAIKYKHEDRNPELFLSFFEENGHLIFEISDNGLGIDLIRHGDRLFQLFKRLHSHVEGSGIGLYSIKQLIERKGGRIEVESELDRGTTFRVYFT
jgi:signal transduction histidine kinase